MEKTICVLRPHRNITGGQAFDVGPGKGNTCSCTGQRLQRAYNAAKKRRFSWWRPESMLQCQEANT